MDGNVILVGDAAGVLDPLTAEGIFAAVRSAQLAAGRIADHLEDGGIGLEGYAEDLEEDILSDIRVAARFHDLFYLWPSLGYRIEKSSPILWCAMVELFRGDATYAGLLRRLGPLGPALRLASHLVRAAPWLRRPARPSRQ